MFGKKSGTNDRTAAALIKRSKESFRPNGMSMRRESPWKAGCPPRFGNESAVNGSAIGLYSSFAGATQVRTSRIFDRREDRCEELLVLRAGLMRSESESESSDDLLSFTRLGLDSRWGLAEDETEADGDACASCDGGRTEEISFAIIPRFLVVFVFDFFFACLLDIFFDIDNGVGRGPDADDKVIEDSMEEDMRGIEDEEKIDELDNDG